MYESGELHKSLGVAGQDAGLKAKLDRSEALRLIDVRRPDLGAKTIQQSDVRCVGPRLDALLAVDISWTFDLVKGKKGPRIFGALDEFFKAELAATFTSQRVNVVESMQQRRPIEPLAVPSRLGLVRLVEVILFAAPAIHRGRLRRRDHLGAPLACRSEDSVKSNERMPRRWNQSAEPGQKLMRLHDAVGSAANRMLELVDDFPIHGWCENVFLR